MRFLCVILGLITLSRTQNPKDLCPDKNYHNPKIEEIARVNCGPAFQNKCLCQSICYDEPHPQYVVNCTDAGFTDTSPLKNLSSNTEVLIFTGNYLEELDWNIFGTSNSFEKLRVIDMSNNGIREIKGKTYHHVQYVQRLILDFNRLSLDSACNHPRVFSNFGSLLELHLTGAFEKAKSKDLASTLHGIFVNSNLTRLIKLHLEQNNIFEFLDSNVFCDLPNLLDLHLGDNALTALNFNLSCLHHLRFLDLQRNKFSRVLERDLHTLDTFAKHGQNVTIDLSGNPLNCSCKLNPFIKWMEKTKIFVRNKNVLRCDKKGESHRLQEFKNCSLKLAASTHPGTTVALIFLSLVLIGLVSALIYVQRADLRKRLEPVIDSVSKRVRYTSISTGDNREMDV
ncbi:phospholipase A2 inhibitor isoform X2 [Cephus cinctus]|nr:phospholipase A2 inhibitor isoform X2 [Cephus cinctus]XP_024941901.1 phospholipase A2 inhibitor isoform X2 [Cephus cinctus]XP_024941902.1 phospholipase A2 inhibitor isoform X2 [Cephus cinctus]XP_024941903.1 phospholipase A2 inhibitor isoform X2 [Cephus cinctus]